MLFVRLLSLVSMANPVVRQIASRRVLVANGGWLVVGFLLPQVSTHLANEKDIYLQSKIIVDSRIVFC